MPDPRTAILAIKAYIFAALRMAPHELLTRHMAVRVIPLAFCLSFPLSTGPEVQQYIVSALNTDSNSIYGSLYQNSIAKFPSLRTWLTGGLHWVYISMGFAIALLSAGPRQPRTLLLRISVSSMIVLMFVDIARRITDLSIQFIFVNMLANLAGGLAIGLLVVTMYSLIEAGFRLTSTSRQWQTPAIFVLLPLAGMLASMATYYFADLLYRPLPVPVAVQLKRQVSGFFIAADPWSKSDPHFSGLEPFSPFATPVSAQNIEWISSLSDIHTEWTGSLGKHDVALELFDGCLWFSAVPDAAKQTFSATKTLRVAFDGNYTIMTASGGDKTFDVQLSNSSAFQLAINEIKDSKAFDASLHLHDQRSPLTLKTNGPSLSFVLFAPFTNRVRKSGLYAGPHRKLSIEIDGTTQHFSFKDASDANSEKIIECRAVSDAAALDSPIPIKGLSVGARLTISRASTEGTTQPITLRATSSGGALKVGTIEARALSDIPSGRLSFAMLNGDTTAVFELDKKAIPFKDYDSLTLMGDLTAQVANDTQLLITGTAHVAWSSNTRLNPTKWERDDGAIQKYIIGMLMAALTGWYKLIGHRFKTNKAFDWLMKHRRP